MKRELRAQIIGLTVVGVVGLGTLFLFVEILRGL